MRLELEGVGRLVQRDPGPERAERHAQRPSPSRGCSPRRTAAGPGAASMDSSARSYWPRTRVPMNPSSIAELAVRDPAVGQGHRRLRQAAARRHDLVEQLALELADQRRERAGVGAHPAGPIHDAGPLDDARQRRAERGRQRRHDPGHRLRVGGLRGPELGRDRARRAPTPGGRSRSARRPRQSTRPRRAARSARRPTTVAAAPSADADQEAGLPDPIVAPGRPVLARTRRARRRSRHRAGTPRSTRSTSRKSDPNRRLASSRNRSGSPVVSCTWTAGPSAAGRLEPVDPEQLGKRRRGRGGRVDDRHALPDQRLDHRAKQRIVRAAEQQGVDRRAGRLGEDELAARVTLAKERRQGLGDGDLGGRSGQVAGLDQRHERRGGVLVDLDRGVLVLDGGEVRVRPDRRRRGDHADSSIARRQRGGGRARAG